MHAGPSQARRPNRSRGVNEAPDGGTDLEPAPQFAMANPGCGRLQVRSMTQVAAEIRHQSPQRVGSAYCSAKVSRTVGRHRTLDALYREERAGLIAYLARRVGSEHARDLAQDVFLRAATSKQLTELVNPAGFLRRIAFNLLVDEVRRQRCRVRTQPLLENADAPSRAAQEDALHVREARHMLEIALAELPQKTARIFTMNRIEKKSYRQIHLELGIALPTVDYHMMKALAHLRHALDPATCTKTKT